MNQHDGADRREGEAGDRSDRGRSEHGERRQQRGVGTGPPRLVPKKPATSVAESAAISGHGEEAMRPDPSGAGSMMYPSPTKAVLFQA